VSAARLKREAAEFLGISRATQLYWHLRRWLREPDSWIQTTAGSLTLAGMYVGSTTAAGAILYLLALVPWFAMIYRQRLWGIVPLNTASVFVAGLNLWRAL
jgi:hypothetical protein